MMPNLESVRQALQCGEAGCSCGEGKAHVHCPAHDPARQDKTPSLSLTEKDKILVHCFNGCPQEAVIAALKDRNLWPSRNGDKSENIGRGLTLEEFAREKKLDPGFLAKHGVSQATGKSGPYLVFAYRDHQGRENKDAVRFRFSMAERPKSKKGGKPMLYGRGRLSEFQSDGKLIICEGESDTLTFWNYGIAAVGMPGKTLTKTLIPGDFSGFDTIYVWQEPDAPEFPGNVAARLPGITVKAIVSPEGIKDVSEAHCRGENVPELVAQLIVEAQTVSPSAPEKQSGAPQNQKEGEPEKTPWVGHFYSVKGGRLSQAVYDGKKWEYRPLANFRARIEEEVTRDDGLRSSKEFHITGNLDTGRPLPPARILAKEYDSLSWITREWGAAASVAPGRSLGAHLVNAIQAHSQGFKRRTVFAHTGWKKINGAWRYLHGGGAIGGGDPVEVDLGENLHLYRLPKPGGKEAALASLRFLEIGPWEITATLISCVHLAPIADLCKVDFSLWIYGPTGSLKSTLAALALSHFGNFSRTTLPGSWFSTVNSLEKLCFSLKDCMVVIDDFMPAANSKESHRRGESAARLIYQAGNRSSRGRLAADLSARPNHYPRCLIISTGEILLPGQRQSATARYLGIELDPVKTPIDKARLTAAQKEQDLYPQAMAAYLGHLASKLDESLIQIRERWNDFRTAFQSRAHLRIPEIQAWLAVGFELFLRFQTIMGTITEDESVDMYDRAWRVFESLGEKHSRVIEGERPTLKFLAILRELFYQGQVYVESATVAGAPPQERETLGWDGADPTKNAELVGWANDHTLFLLPEMTLRAVNDTIRRQCDFISLGKNDLLAALAREGFIEPRRGENAPPTWIQGATKRVICLPLEKLFPDEVPEGEKQ